MPFSPLHLLAFAFLLGTLAAFVQIGLLTIAFDKLGLSPAQGMLLFLGSLAGSVVNIPVAEVRAQPPPAARPVAGGWGLLRLRRPFTGRTVIAVNLGGCVIPVLFSLHLLAGLELASWRVAAAVGAVVAFSHAVSRPVPGIGIVMPALAPPMAAALVALLLGEAQRAPLAYVAGTLGVLIGADLLRLGDVRRLGTPLASIGGAGTFDGIFITGVVAALLA